jgi:hypothetical protein
MRLPNMSVSKTPSASSLFLVSYNVTLLKGVSSLGAGLKWDVFKTSHDVRRLATTPAETMAMARCVLDAPRQVKRPRLLRSR